MSFALTMMSFALQMMNFGRDGVHACMRRRVEDAEGVTGVALRRREQVPAQRRDVPEQRGRQHGGLGRLPPPRGLQRHPRRAEVGAGLGQYHKLRLVADP